MSIDTAARSGPVQPTAGALGVLHPLAFSALTIDDGFWADRQRINRGQSIAAAWEHLHASGNFENFELAAASPEGGRGADYRGPFFMDTDVHKWLEAVSWETGRAASPEFSAWSAEAVAAVAAAQQADGYVNSYVQAVPGPGGRWQHLATQHELYILGHLIQAAVARFRSTGERDLLAVAERMVDLVIETFGPDSLQGVDGHPEIETALVELYRVTGRADQLELARYFVGARGHDLVDPTGERSAYYSDHVPVRAATTVDGHAVRALYLQAGVVDLAVETHDRELLARSEAVWAAMLDAKTYLTGGAGSRWEDEAFGAPFELAPDRAYAETCAAQAAVQWSWRLLLATGDPRYADHIERTLFNGFAAGSSLDGDHYFYVNTLQLRGGSIPGDERDPVNGRLAWFGCACCPPSVLRTLSVLHTYLATVDSHGIQLHQYASSTLTADIGGAPVSVTVQTAYPHDGSVVVTVADTPETPWALSLRIPAWCTDATLTIDGAPIGGPFEPGTMARVERVWTPGTRIELALPMPVRMHTSDDRVDATRGSVAFTRGPLVYAFEQVDQAADAAVDDLRIRAVATTGTALPVPAPSTGAGGGTVAAATVTWRPELLGGVNTLGIPAELRADSTPFDAVAVPYAVWANRAVGPMRVWTPLAAAVPGA
jgi:DUF1680 family protein